MKIRLDKFLANSGLGSRSEIKKSIKEKKVKVNGKIIVDVSFQVDIDFDDVSLNDKSVKYEKYIYIMMNKKEGYISATYDKKYPIVIDLLGEKEKNFKPFPVGRLDKDTEGLLILTNDGLLAHKLLKPKKKILKNYYVITDKKIEEKDIKIFSEGMDLGDFETLPASLEIIKEDISLNKSELELRVINEVDDLNGKIAKVGIVEGKFHQVKRMFKFVGKEVLYLKRLSMGEIKLDENLKVGEYRNLSDDEIQKIK